MNHSGNQKEKQNNHSSWMDHPDLSGMDPSKLAMLNLLAEQGARKSSQELLPFLMSAASQNRSRGFQFSSQEIDAIVQVLKAGKSPAETARMDQILQMIKLMR